MSDENVYYRQRQETQRVDYGQGTDQTYPSTSSPSQYAGNSTRFVASENGSPMSKQFSQIQGAWARMNDAHYHLLPEDPDQHGQYKLFNYYPPQLTALGSTMGANPKSIAQVLAMAKQQAGPELVHDISLNPLSLKVVKQAVKRGDVKSPISQFTGERTPIEDYENQVGIETDNEIDNDRDELESQGYDSFDAYQNALDKHIDYLKGSGDFQAKTEIKNAARLMERGPNRITDSSVTSVQLSRGEVEQAVREAHSMREPDTSQQTLAADQEAALSEYTKIQEDAKHDTDLFGNPTVTRKLFRWGKQDD